MKNLTNTMLILTLATLGSTGLVAMKRPRDGDAPEASAAKKQKVEDVKPQRFHELFPGTLFDQLLPELDSIVQDYKHALVLIDTAKNALEAGLEVFKASMEELKFYDVLEKLLKIYGHDVLVILLKDYFKKNPELVCMEDQNSNTALHCAVEENNQPMVKLLLDAAGPKACDLVCMQDGWGCTVLHYAVDNNNEDVVKLLLDIAGVRACELVRMQDEWDETALGYAKDKNEAIVQLIKQYLPDEQ